MKDLVLIGGGGHCRSCIDVIEMEGKYRIAGFVDLPEKAGLHVFGYRYLGSDDDLEDLAREYEAFLITLGQIRSPKRRIQLFEKLKEFNVNLPVIISPIAYVSKHAHIREGTIIMHHAIVNAGAEIGKNCIINNKALIEHDAVIGDHCHIATAAVVNGGVHVSSGTFLGSNVVVKENIEIGENVIVGCGAKIVQNIVSNTKVK